MSYRARCTAGVDGRGGSALVVVLLGTAVLLALAAAAVLLAASDLLAASRQRDATVARSAAEAELERAAAEIVNTPEWTLVLSGAATSSRVDGAASDARIPFGEARLSPEQVASLATCGTPAPCTPAACAAATSDRPWGADNPRWVPYSWGPADRATPGQAATYVVVLAGDDPAENDGDPTRDGLAPANPGADRILLRAEAFGPAQTRRVVEAAIARVTVRPGVAAPRVLSWGEVR